MILLPLYEKSISLFASVRRKSLIIPQLENLHNGLTQTTVCNIKECKGYEQQQKTNFCSFYESILTFHISKMNFHNLFL